MDDREVAIAAAKKRMAAFRLRQASSVVTPTDFTPLPSKHHARSHSRNNSITNFPLSTSSVNNAPSVDETMDNLSSVPSSPSPRSRPNSHHRRRSSVSTRRESAEMMGVTPPPESSTDITGDPTELRRLALWALEGKNRSDSAFIGGFATVEIPELDDTEAEGNFDTVQTSKLKPTLPTFGIGNLLTGKRDSFGKLLLPSSNSLKDQLHTLIEEEEDEEEEVPKENTKQIERGQSFYSSHTSDSFQGEAPFRTESPLQDEAMRPSASSRHRPTNLTLRPLSLTPDSLPITRTEALPTPSPTPSPRIGGLRTLTLAPSHSPASSNSSTTSRRQSLSVSPSPQPTEQVQRRMSLGSTPSPAAPVPSRKSSISYKRAPSGDHSAGYLPTPGPTPTSTMPPPLHSTLPTISNATSVSGGAADLERPLSPTEQAFLFRSHTSLLCRISDLERAIADGGGRLPPGAGVPGMGFGLETLSSRSPSRERPVSITSMSSESISESESAPSDEMLQLVADLKAERDELMRNATTWRTRNADLERQVATLTRRVEAERREGWVARERLGVMEVEKKRVREEVEDARLELRRLEKLLQAEVEARMRAEDARDAGRTRCEAAEREVETLRTEMTALRVRADQADADLQSLLTTPKVDVRMQMPVIRRLNSVDSGTSGSATDVEEYVPLGLRTLKLNAVAEEEEERDLPHDVTSEGGNGSEMEDEDELAHYEDDEGLDDDMIFSDDQTSSSFGSIARSNSHLMRLDLAAVAPTRAIVPALAHNKTGSMERGWSFPAQPASGKRVELKVDRFFECLDALDESDTEPEGGLPTYDSATAKQFWRTASQADDDEGVMPPFVLPTQPSPPRKDKEWKEVEAAKLEIVEEEDEESISFKFPVCTDTTLLRSPDIIKDDPVTPCPKRASFAPIGTPTKHPRVRRMSKDLKIPGFKAYSGSVPVLKAPPPPRRSTSPSTITTPTKSPEMLSKETSPTQIPQLSRSPSSSLTTPPKPRNPGPTFIPRPSTSSKPSSTTPTARTPTKFPSTTASTKMSTPTAATKAATPLTPPVLMPHPRLSSNSVTRSSILPYSAEPSVLMWLATPQQSIASRTQGLTAKLSQGFTSLWSPWGASASVQPEIQAEFRSRGYVGKERQLERLRVRLQRESASATPSVQCAGCRDGVIEV